MTEQWKSDAAKRFNDRIVLRPTDLFWPQDPPEPTAFEELVEANLDLFQVVVDRFVLGRVA